MDTLLFHINFYFNLSNFKIKKNWNFIRIQGLYGLERNDRYCLLIHNLFCMSIYLILSCQSVSQFSCSVVPDSLRPPWTAACQASLSIANSRILLKLMSFELVMPFSHLILCHPLLLPPSIFPSIRVFSNSIQTEYLTWAPYVIQQISTGYLFYLLCMFPCSGGTSGKEPTCQCRRR